MARCAPACDPLGHVFVQGALWRARTSDESVLERRPDQVVVDAVDGLTLTVSPAPAPAA